MNVVTTQDGKVSWVEFTPTSEKNPKPPVQSRIARTKEPQHINAIWQRWFGSIRKKKIEKSKKKKKNCKHPVQSLLQAGCHRHKPMRPSQISEMVHPKRTHQRTVLESYLFQVSGKLGLNGSSCLVLCFFVFLLIIIIGIMQQSVRQQWRKTVSINQPNH